MALLQSRITSVQNYLASQFMNVDEEWISGCVEYISEDSSNNYTLAEIQNLAKEQWLLNDLKDICPGCLPPNLSNSPKTTLNGRYVLQINAAIDIGTPAYQQYLKLQKANMENIEATSKFDDKVPSHRMIKLYLTDGKQEISGIEYRPMRNLSCDITPGCKMLLKGPIDCRRGVLLLTECSIELLGGEVSDIAVSNSLAGLLASKLELPLPQEADHNTTISIPRNINIPTPHSIMPSRPNDEPTNTHQPDPGFSRTRPDEQPITHVTSRPVARVTSVQVANFDEEIDFDQIEAIEAEFSSKRSLDSTNLPVEKKIKIDQSKGNIPNRVHNSIDYPVNRANNPIDYPVNRGNNPIDYPVNRGNNIFDYTVNRANNPIDYPVNRGNNNPIDYPVNRGNNNPIDYPVNNSDDYPEDNDFNEDEDYLREMEAAFDRKDQSGSKDQKEEGIKDQIGPKDRNTGPKDPIRPILVLPEPFVYIKQIENMSKSECSGRVFRVKAQIMKLLSKLSVGKEGWSLKCTIIDGTGSLDVDFTSDVLSKLVGYTPQEMNQLKKDMVTKPELKEKAVAALHKAKETLQVLYCIIELHMQDVPKITALIQFDGCHVNSLKKRLDGSGL